MKQREPEPDEHESRAVVALTVAWMLTCMSTAVAMLVALVLMLLMAAFPMADRAVHPLHGIAAVFWFLSLVTGVLCLAFTVLVLRTRQMAPPRPITIAAILIGLAPIVTMIVFTLVGR